MKINMIGRIDPCVLLAYRTPAASVRQLLPAPLKLVERDGWAFWNIVACRVEKMRPAGFPHCFGSTYCHVAYRLYATVRTADGRTVDGLYFLRSDVNDRFMTITGNCMTDFRFHRADIQLIEHDNRLDLDITRSKNGLGDARLRVQGETESNWQPSPCFTSRAEAAAFLKYRPAGLAPDRDGTTVRVAEVFRNESDWKETPVQVIEAKWPFFASMSQLDIRLELATRVARIDYRWQLGRQERTSNVR